MNLVEAKKQKIEILSYIIGLLSFILLGKLTDNNGVTYMAVIIESVSFFVLIINGRSAELIGRLLRNRRKKNQYKEAGELHKAILLIQVIAAVVMMAAYFFLTDVLATMVFKLPFLAVAMKILTPVILLSVLQSAVLGYFQGSGSHMPTVVSSIFRQLLFLLFGLLFTGRLMNYGTKVSSLLNNEDFAGMYGAVGLCLAILIAEILVSLFLLIVYIGSDRKKEQKKTESGMQKLDSFSERCRLFCLTSLSEILVGVLKMLPFLLAVLLVIRNAEDISAVAYSYGIFFRGFVCVCAIAVFIMITGMLNSLCKLTGAVKAKDNRTTRSVIYAGLHYSWVVGLYTAVCLAVLAPLFSRLLDKAAEEILQQYYTYGAAVVAVLVLNIYLWKMLQIMGAEKVNMISLALFNVVFVISYLILSGREMDSMLALCLAALVGSLVQLIFSFVFAVRKYVLQPDMIRGFVIPIVAAGVMGLLTMLVQNLLSPHLGCVACLLLCLAISIIVYLTVLVLTRSIRETEVSYVYGPLGRKILGMIIR